MNNFPFFRLPYSNYYNYCKKPRGYYSYNSLNNNSNKAILSNKILHNKENNVKNSNFVQNTNVDEDAVQVNKKKEIDKKNRSSKYSNFGPINLNFDFFSNSENPIIEFMGIKLYLDDLIIIGILFLLYNEDVKDEVLFIILILLLLS